MGPLGSSVTPNAKKFRLSAKPDISNDNHSKTGNRNEPLLRNAPPPNEVPDRTIKIAVARATSCDTAVRASGGEGRTAASIPLLLSRAP